MAKGRTNEKEKMAEVISFLDDCDSGGWGGDHQAIEEGKKQSSPRRRRSSRTRHPTDRYGEFVPYDDDDDHSGDDDDFKQINKIDGDVDDEHGEGERERGSKVRGQEGGCLSFSHLARRGTKNGIKRKRPAVDGKERGHEKEEGRVPVLSTTAISSGGKKRRKMQKGSQGRTKKKSTTLRDENSGDRGVVEKTQGDGGGRGGANSASKGSVYRHQCPDCDYGTNIKSSLTSHLRTHTGERPFVCAVTGCGRAFSQKGSLLEHLRRHAKIKRFHCTFEGCDYKSVTKSHLTRHLRTHTGERPFTCSYCDYCAAHRSTLRTHERRHYS